MGRAKILIADDHGVVRRGMRLLLEAQSGWEVCAEAADGRDAVKKASATKPDVAIVDLTMPRLNGLDALRKIRHVSPRTKMLLFTVHEREDLSAEVLDAGGSGYLLKSDAESELVVAVEAILAGSQYMSSRIAPPVRSEPRRASRRLSPREREVLQLIAEGRSTKEIARELGISVKTADTHRTHLMLKVGLHSTADLVRYAVRNRFVQA